MNEVVNVEMMETEVVPVPTMRKEIVDTVLNAFKDLPKGVQMTLLGAGVVSAIGLTAYGIKRGYGVVITDDGIRISNQ